MRRTWRDRLLRRNRDPKNQASAGDTERLAVSSLGSNWLTGIGQSSALESATVAGAIRLIASAMAQMPLEIRDTRRPQATMPDHPVEQAWNVRPCPRFTGPQLTEWVVRHMIEDGNAYVLIDRDARTGALRSLWPLRPTNVDVRVQQRGRLTYHILSRGVDMTDGLTPPPGTPAQVDQDRMLHFASLYYDGRCGQSPTRTGMRRAAATDIAMSRYIEAMYRSGAIQQFALRSGKRISPETARQMQQWWSEHYARGVDSAGEPIILSEGLEMQQLQSSAREQQMAEAREFQISDVLRAIGVPGILMNQENKSTSWGTGIQETKAGFLAFTVQEYVRRVEGEINAKLFARTTEYATLKSDRLLRGTTKERYASHAAALGGGANPGWKSVNEIRIEEGLDPLEGDEYDRPYKPGPETPQTEVEIEVEE